MKLKVKVVTEETCKAAMEPPPTSFNITESLICAGGVKDRDTCQAEFSQSGAFSLVEDIHHCEPIRAQYLNR